MSNLKKMYHPSVKMLFIGKIIFFYLLVNVEDASY